jgi:hypothetical protein
MDERPIIIIGSEFGFCLWEIPFCQLLPVVQRRSFCESRSSKPLCTLYR